MSELSESVHFWRTPPEVVRMRITRMGVVGYIVDANERWTSFVSLDESELDVVGRESPEVVLRWLYAANSELELTLLKSGCELGVLRLMWEMRHEGYTVQSRDAGLVQAMREAGMTVEADALAVVAERAEEDALPPKELRDLVANAIGLTAYEWLSPRYARGVDFDVMKQQFPNAQDLTDEFSVN